MQLNLDNDLFHLVIHQYVFDNEINRLFVILHHQNILVHFLQIYYLMFELLDIIPIYNDEIVLMIMNLVVDCLIVLHYHCI